MRRVVLAYSGDASSSMALAWLRRDQDVEVVTVTLDLGQGAELAAVREQALALGAVRAHVLDTREQFARDFVVPALQAGAFSVDLGLGSALARVLIATRAVDIARMESADAVAHASREDSLGRRLLNATIGQLDPRLTIIEIPSGSTLSEEERAQIARTTGVQPGERSAAIDANLWSRTLHTGADAPDEDRYLLTRSADDAPEGAASLDIEFVAGVPVCTNGVEMPLLELIESIETIAGAHGVGRALGGNRIVEAPAAMVLATAHAALEATTLGADLSALKNQLATVYATHVKDGRWLSDAKAAIDAFVAVTQPRVTGIVRLRLLKGGCSVEAQQSPNDVRTTGARTPKAVA